MNYKFDQSKSENVPIVRPIPLHPVARQHDPNSTHHDTHRTVHLECALLRVSFNGRTLASQANNVGSIPITRSNQRLSSSAHQFVAFADQAFTKTNLIGARKVAWIAFNRALTPATVRFILTQVDTLRDDGWVIGRISIRAECTSTQQCDETQ